MVKSPPANARYMGSMPSWEDPTYCGAPKPMQPQLLSRHSRARALQPEASMLQLEKAHVLQ